MLIHFLLLLLLYVFFFISVRAMPLLTTLFVSQFINNEVLLTISSSLSHLRTLSLSGNTYVTENGFKTALQTLPVSASVFSTSSSLSPFSSPHQQQILFHYYDHFNCHPRHMLPTLSLSSFSTPPLSPLASLTSLLLHNCSMATDSICSIILKAFPVLTDLQVADTEIGKVGVLELLQLPR